MQMLDREITGAEEIIRVLRFVGAVALARKMVARERLLQMRKELPCRHVVRRKEILRFLDGRP
jgi:hypothetical protein